MTLEDYFRETFAKDVIDHSVRANVDGNLSVTFYIHPSGVDGETMDFQVRGNELNPRFGAVKMAPVF